MIEIENVSKVFAPPLDLRALWSRRESRVLALSDVNLTVSPGEVLGVMGANGAGKSTLLRLVAGVVTATTGKVSVKGVDVALERARAIAHVGYMPGDERGLLPALSPREQLAFFGALHGLGRAAGLARADRLLDELGLKEVAHRPAGQLSTGMRRRLSLARALVGQPTVLALDEPTRAVDPAGVVSLRSLIGELAARGATMLLVTHDLEEARQLCSRIAVLKAGEVVVVTSAAEAALHLGMGTGT